MSVQSLDRGISLEGHRLAPQRTILISLFRSFSNAYCLIIISFSQPYHVLGPRSLCFTLRISFRCLLFSLSKIPGMRSHKLLIHELLVMFLLVLIVVFLYSVKLKGLSDRRDPK